MTASIISAKERETELRLRREEEKWVRRCCPEIVGTDAELLAALQITRMAAEDGDCTVLLTGETGTGKELISRVVHNHSRRNGYAFNAINAASLPPTLADSLLFGHQKGAYTDAIASTQGVFRATDGGTVFLDEIQELDLQVQAKLLRFLEDRLVVPLGGEERRPVDVRIIAGSNGDLQEAVERGAFRTDLYFRLDVLPIHLPPLRERREDIPLLVSHFLEEFNSKKGCRVSISPTAIAALIDHDWPGNVRELRNLIERMVIVCRNRAVRYEDLPAAFVRHRQATAPPTGPATSNLKQAKEQLITTFERDFIYRHWAENGWQITRTAAVLGESRQWLSRQIRKYGLVPGKPVQTERSRRETMSVRNQEAVKLLDLMSPKSAYC